MQTTQNSNTTKTITVLLTKCRGIGSKIMCFLTRSKFSHACISLDNENKEFYSFNYNGLGVEHHKRRDGLCIQMRVPETVYFQIHEKIKSFFIEQYKYTYSYFGVILCLLHIPHKFKRHYFCSQFVAELLSYAGIGKLRKQASLYLPMDLINEVDYSNQVVYRQWLQGQCA